MKRREGLVLFTGIDGSGKTTQALDCVRENPGLGYRWLRWEPYLTRPAMALMRLLMRREAGGNSERPIDDSGHREFVGKKQRFFQSAWRQRLWTTVVLLEYLPQCLFRLGLARVRARRILCDRYLHDVAIDLSLNYGTGVEGIQAVLQHPLARLFPRPDLILVFDLEPRAAFERKQDGTPLAYMEHRVPLYQSLIDESTGRRIDASRPRMEVLREVVAVLKETGFID